MKKEEGKNALLDLTQWGKGGLLHSSIINLHSYFDPGLLHSSIINLHSSIDQGDKETMMEIQIKTLTPIWTGDQCITILRLYSPQYIKKLINQEDYSA